MFSRGGELRDCVKQFLNGESGHVVRFRHIVYHEKCCFTTRNQLQLWRSLLLQ
jgi:hypothetical protein